MSNIRDHFEGAVELKVAELDFQRAPLYRKTERYNRRDIRVLTETEQVQTTTWQGRPSSLIEYGRAGDAIISGTTKDGKPMLTFFAQFTDKFEKDPHHLNSYRSRETVRAYFIDKSFRHTTWGASGIFARLAGHTSRGKFLVYNERDKTIEEMTIRAFRQSFSATDEKGIKSYPTTTDLSKILRWSRFNGWDGHVKNIDALSTYLRSHPDNEFHFPGREPYAKTWEEALSIG